MKSLKSFINNRKTGKPSIFPKVSMTLLIICFVMTGCFLVKLKKEVNQSYESTTIVGLVKAQLSGDGPIIVAARSISKGKEIPHYTVLHESGEYELMVDQGKYHIFAYQDKNSNLIYEAGEPAGQYGDTETVSAPAVGVVYNINITIPEEGGDVVIPHGTEISSVKPEKLHSRQAGAITDLDDERFSEENGAKGFWEGVSFFKRFGGNIFFLEEYDPEKTPVLFIHGAAGTPKGWKYIVDNIDRTRFQPWFFYYPTGSRINGMAYLLLWKLSNLQTKYKFNKLYITAHSMGGLVAKSFLVNYGRQFPYVKLFISLATPWGGDKMAEYGVQQSPAVIPSWIDMQPEGDFIKSLYSAEMPEYVRFYMFYGHRGSRNPLLSNNDGTIALSSLLDFRAQSEAEMNYAFNEDHASIVYSKEVLTQYNTILNESDKKLSASPYQSGGHLNVRFSYNYDFDGERPRPILALRSIDIDKTDTEIVTVLSDDDNSRIIGPFPPGDYLVGMVTIAAKTKKKYVRITIESGMTKVLDFVFIPDGVVRGVVTAPLKQEEQYVGRPDYSFRTADKSIDIQSIVLKGYGVHRTLQPIKSENVNENTKNYDWAITRADLCYNNFFAFFGLPAGVYQLTIKAEGYKTVVDKYSVTPGVPKYFRVTELTPE
ncbi:alpha/beta hydrolase [Desulfococcaceae bacterium HSG7]|nr:alpha/beta hydrolase [Desulfococcaceae bacterium HSG7]